MVNMIWENLYDHLMSMEIIILVMNMILMQAM